MTKALATHTALVGRQQTEQTDPAVSLHELPEMVLSENDKIAV